MLHLAGPALALAVALAPAGAAGEAPAKDAGQMKRGAVQKTEVIDLGPEFEGMRGRQLRVVQVDPGAGHAHHTHEERPEVAYLGKGTLTETRAGKVTLHRAGESWSSPRGTTHEFQNKGTDPATLISVDIVKAE